MDNHCRPRIHPQGKSCACIPYTETFISCIWLTVPKIDLIIPQECHAVLRQKLVEQRQQPCYARVTMTLGQVLEGDFFSEYIKKGRNHIPVRRSNRRCIADVNSQETY